MHFHDRLFTFLFLFLKKEKKHGFAVRKQKHLNFTSCRQQPEYENRVWADGNGFKKKKKKKFKLGFKKYK